MDQFQAELQAAINAAQTGHVPQPGEEPFLINQEEGKPQQPPRQKPPGLEQFTHEQIVEMYKTISEGKMPEELLNMQNNFEEKYTDAEGNPIIDEEGGAVIQPTPGFVVKTKDINDQSKIFINMTHHDLVEPFEEKSIPKEEAAKIDASETGIRIPLSLGTVREDSDKRGDPVQVFDIIWNPKTVKQAQKDAGFRQAMVELAFSYITQKHGRNLDLRFTIPKMKYKGATVQYQRVKAKKNPKIKEVHMTEEEKRQLEERAMEEERRKEALREKEPKWNLFCIMDSRLNKDFASSDYLSKLVKESFDNDCTGDDNDRWSHLLDHFELKQQFDVFEEYDGLNQDEAEGLLLVVSLPMLARGHAIQCHNLRGQFIQIQVPTLYYLGLGLPIETNNVVSYYDCKIRRLFVHMTKKAVEAVQPTEPVESEEVTEPVEKVPSPQKEKPEEKIEARAEPEETDLMDDIIEIDTDEHFGRETGTKV